MQNDLQDLILRRSKFFYRINFILTLALYNLLKIWKVLSRMKISKTTISFVLLITICMLCGYRWFNYLVGKISGRIYKPRFRRPKSILYEYARKVQRYQGKWWWNKECCQSSLDDILKQDMLQRTLSSKQKSLCQDFYSLPITLFSVE